MIKSKPKKRDWRKARAKLESESVCRVCRRIPSGSLGDRLEAAHVIARRNDSTEVDPLDIVGLCTADHLAYDGRQLDLLPFLYPDEQARGCLQAGGAISFLKRVSPMGGTW